MKNIISYTKWRWWVGLLLLLGELSAAVIWIAPSPILTIMCDDIGMSLGQAGIMMSIVCLIYSVTTLLFDRINNKISANKVFLAGLVFMSAGQGAFLWANTFNSLILLRAIIGIGLGICAPVYAVLVVRNFPEKERPIINTIYSALPYIASFISLYATIPLLNLCGGLWRECMAILGLIVFIVALVYGLSLKKVISPPKNKRNESLVREVAKNRQIRLLLLADTCDMWGYNFLSSFLPTFLILEKGMSLERSATIALIFPAVGMIAGLTSGMLMSKTGRRKIFTWPMHIAVFIGTLMIAFCNGSAMVAGIALAGAGNAGWAPALYTIPMEISGMTDKKVGAAFALIFGIGYLSAFISPLVGGIIGDSFGLRTTFVINSIAAIVAAITTFSMKENVHMVNKI